MIEHSFVTTLPPEQAMGMASAFLTRGGFVAEADGAFDLAGGGRWTTLQLRRGRKTTARARGPIDSPQRVRLEWDRGRVTVAASIDPPVNRTRPFLYGGVIGLAVAAAQSKGKRVKAYADLMVAISQDVDDLLVGRTTPETAGGRWFPMEQVLQEKARKARVRSWIYVGLLLLFVAGLVVLGIVAGSHH